ncbi:bifunctional oligoribonuclease/PAP phosphatase NrnA [Dysgonomonas sp. 511]|uniref:DHH family phosphoesterase n=1 Tax=Dysgonomonas sp. 511 TaxID=2302930 RepID=UPI0013D17C80|nr:bifunctional oligoribonuclease/PAP phosphatase NrnA [Dysgonomonas sp. 511]NDV79458.1 bifunctional oligoribonuclease/PAP phosphatase NrnA [Dysgonomonas sp. 511]
MLVNIIASSKISQVEELLDKYEKIVIITHVSPDGDAIGSSLGLYHYLTALGNEVNVVVPNSFPDFLKWIPGSKEIVDFERYPDFAQKLIAEAELIFCLDFNVPKRVSQIGPYIEAAKGKKILVDHHPDPADFCDVVISYPEISSTSELIFRLICRMGDFEMMNFESATAIYTGMMTDTGAFTYNSNSPQIYYIIGELLKKGIDKDQIYSNVYHNYSEDRYRMLGFTLCEKMKIYPEYNSALIWLTNEEQRRFKVKKGDTEGFANLPLNIKGIIFSVFIREDNDFIKISFRSQGDFPSNRFAAQCYNGGGHLNAAGGEFFGTMEEAIDIFEKALPEFGDLLKNNKKK